MDKRLVMKICAGVAIFAIVFIYIVLRLYQQHLEAAIEKELALHQQQLEAEIQRQAAIEKELEYGNDLMVFLVVAVSGGISLYLTWSRISTEYGNYLPVFLVVAVPGGIIRCLRWYGISTVLVVAVSVYLVWYIISTADVRKLRKKIENYRPGQWTDRDSGGGFRAPSKIRLGVFGVQDSGKSAFLNSLHFAFKGVWKQIYLERARLGAGGESMFRDPRKLTHYITTLDTRGLVDLASSRVEEVTAELCGEVGIDTRTRVFGGVKIDCPIFVLKYSSVVGMKHCIEFLRVLVRDIRVSFGTYPIMVVTFADSITDREDILDKIVRAGLEKGSVFFIENYTAENNKMDYKKHVALLRILEACILRADSNIIFRWLRGNERPQPSKPSTPQVKITPARWYNPFTWF